MKTAGTVKGAIALVCLAAAFAAAPAAQAAYPGANGKIVFFEDGITQKLISMDPNGSNQQDYFSPASSAPSFSADGTKVAYEEFGSIVVRNTDGSGTPVTLTPLPLGIGQTGFHDFHDPALSSDGTKVAYQDLFVLTSPIVLGDSSIRIANVDGSGVPASISGSMTVQNLEPTFSPDGGTIFYQRYTAANLGDVYQAPSTGGSGTAIDGAATSSNEGDPEISPDGTTLVFEKLVGEYDLLYVVLSAPTMAFNLIADGQGQMDPAFSPDGTKIAYAQDDTADGDPDDIYTADADGDSPSRVNVTDTPGSNDSNPGWSAPFPVPTTPLGTPPASTSPPPTTASATAAAAPKKCKKGRKLKKGKCVRKKKKK